MFLSQLIRRFMKPSCRLIELMLIALAITSSYSFGDGSISEYYRQMRFQTPFESGDNVAQELGGVNALVQDKFGFLWIGAENGLARYDGRTLLHYKAVPGDETTLPANYIFQMVVDASNTLWVATEGGLASYDPTTDRFTHIGQVGGTRIDVESVSALALGEDDTLYVGTARGLYVIDPDRKIMKYFLPLPPITIEPNIEQIRDIAIDAQNKIWLATAGMGVAVFDPSSQQFTYHLHDPGNPHSLVHNSVRAIYQDNKGRLWLGTYGGGVSRLDPGRDSFVNFSYSPSEPNSLKSNVIWDILQDSEGTIFLAVDQGGLARYVEDLNGFVHYHHRPYDPTSLVSNQLRVIYEDDNQDLWFGSSPSGVGFFTHRTSMFRHYITKPADPNSLSNNAALRIIEARDGTIWIGTEGGLNALDPATGKIQRYLADPGDPNALNANAVLAIEEDIDGQLWVGTWSGGLHKMDPTTGYFRRYLPDANDPTSINSAFIWDIIRDRKNNIWVATETGGLNRYHRETDNFSHYVHNPNKPQGISGNFISSLMEDSNGHLWLGGYTGVNVFDPIKETFRKIPYETGQATATNSKNTKAFFEASDGRVWIGTQHRGVNIFDPVTETFSYLETGDGLPSQNVSGIIEDEEKNIWLATGNGIAKVDWKTGVLSVYDRASDLAGSNYNREAVLKDHSGRLYFGSSEGVTSFKPVELRVDATDFPIRLVGFRIFNEEVAIKPDGPLQRSIVSSDKILLRHKDSMFSFRFAALDFRNSSSIHYSYLLEGFDSNWNNIENLSTATYTNISPGKYVFRVRATLDKENWIEGQSVTVEILPPPWRTWWAYLLYAVIAVLAFNYRHNHVLLRARAEIYRTRSITDPLTELYNRLGITQVAEGIFANTETKKNVGVVLFDIDHFKKINDRYGHDIGDQVLVDVATTARRVIRHSDSLARWGGEEFLLLSSVRDNGEGLLLAEKIRSAIASHVFPLEENNSVTVSLGFTMLKASDSLESAVKRADLALYQAKAEGRNRVKLAND